MILDGTNPANIAKAAQQLRSGAVVAFATETVYGLGAVFNNESALEKVFALKGRPKTDPLIVHVSSKEQLDPLITGVSKDAKALIERFWPGPLTLIFQKSDEISPLITAGQQTVAVRWPRHPVAQALISEVGSPIAAPSANKFQQISPTSASDVESELGGELIVLDGGPCERGIESTIVSVVDEPCVLRLGAICLEDLADCLGTPPKLASHFLQHSSAQSSPGQLELHYAPKSPLKLMPALDSLDQISQQEKLFGYFLVFSNRERDALIKKGFQRIRVLSPTGKLSEAARNLYAELRWLDQQRPRQIFAVRVPDRLEGKAINDRLRRASHG